VAGQVSQRHPQRHPRQRHSGLEGDQQHADAYPLRPRQVHFTEHGKGDGKGVETQRQRKGQQFKHAPTLATESARVACGG
jgi:hypothetical protein